MYWALWQKILPWVGSYRLVPVEEQLEDGTSVIVVRFCNRCQLQAALKLTAVSLLKKKVQEATEGRVNRDIINSLACQLGTIYDLGELHDSGHMIASAATVHPSKQMGKGLKKSTPAADTLLGRLQQDLNQKLKASRKAGQELVLSQHDFQHALDLCLGALDSHNADTLIEQNQSSHLDVAAEALQVLALLLPLAPAPKNQQVPAQRRVWIVRTCWSLWAATAALHHKSQAAIEAVLRLSNSDKVHSEAPGESAVVAADDPALLCLLDLLKAHRLASKRSLTCFAFLLPLAPSALVQDRFPNLLPDLLATLSQPELSTHAGKAAFLALQEQHAETNIVASLGQCLVNMEAQSRTALSLYVLGPLFALDQGWYGALTTWFNAHEETIAQADASKILPAKLALIETAYRAGVTTRQSIDNDMLDQALASSQPHIRMSALAIIARLPPSRQSALATADFDLLSRHFLPFLSKTPDPEERNAITGHWKVILDRLRGSTYAANRNCNLLQRDATTSTSEEAQARFSAHHRHLVEAKSFLAEAHSAFVEGLHPLAPYRVQSSALRYLTNLYLSGLVECWKDTTSISTSAKKTAQVFWPFALDGFLDLKMTLRRLTGCLNSTYEDIQNAAFLLLRGFPTSHRPSCLVSSTTLAPRIRSLLNNGRRSQAQTAALLLQLGDEHEDMSSQASSAVLRALEVARAEVNQVKRNLSLAADSCPMHGAIHCLMCVSLDDGVSPFLMWP